MGVPGVRWNAVRAYSGVHLLRPCLAIAHSGLTSASTQTDRPCPLCGARLRLKHCWFYWLFLALVTFGVSTPLTLFGVLRYGLLAGALMGILGGLVVGLPLDKYMESRFAIVVVDR